MRYDELDIDILELKGLSRSFGELEWLTLILMLLYTVTQEIEIEFQAVVAATMVLFAGFVLGFRYCNFSRMESRVKLAIEVHVMLLAITSMIWCTGKIDSPLMNLYLLVIIATALTLGKMITFLQLMLIVSCHIFMTYAVNGDGLFSLGSFAKAMANFAPFLLVAYLTTMLSSDLSFAKNMMKRRSETDELTGVMNARGFKRSFEKTVNMARRYGRPFSLMLIDADNLKQVNDTLGHTAGDQLIQDIANRVRSQLRDCDELARYGGDEFVIILPETEAAGAIVLAKRINTAVAQSSAGVKNPALATTVSIGIAAFPEDTATAGAVFECADAALYRSKETGRNRVTLYSQLRGAGERDRAAPPAQLYKLSA